MNDSADIRIRIEARFKRWGYLVARRRVPVLLLSLAVAAGLTAGLSGLRIDTSTESFLRKGDPILISYEKFQDQFGRAGVLMVGVEAPDIFDLGFLEKLRKLHAELEGIPHLADIDSLITARDTRGIDDELIVEDLFEHWPANEAELAPLRARARANPMYENLLISSDGTFTILMIELQAHTSLDADEVALTGFGIEEDRSPLKYLTGGEILESVLFAEAVLARYDGPGFSTHMAGAPLMQQKLQERMQREMALFVGLSLAVIGIFLWILFRRPTGVLFPMGVVVLSLLSTLGAMGWAGVPLTLPTQILPSFILAAGVGAAVHILTIFYQCVARGDSREDSIADALGHSGLAVAMTGLTTAGALASFLSAELAPVVHFGIFAPLGAILILFYSLVLMPAVIALTPIGTRVRSAGGARFLDAFLERCAQISTQHPWGVLGISGALVIAALTGFPLLHKSYDPMVWFPETEAIRIDTQIIDERFNGTMAVEVLINTPEENGLYEPALLEAIDAAMRHAEATNYGIVKVGKANSVSIVVKEINQALHSNEKAHYSIPTERQLIAQELLLFENTGADDLENVVDSQFKTARVSLRVPYVDAVHYPPFMDAVEADFVQRFDDTVQVQLTGMMAIMSRTLDAVVDSVIRSYMLALLIITPLMIFLIGSLRGGLLSMIPNLFPIVITLGVMGWFGYPLQLFTLLIGCISIGLAVDDTIHFMHNFQRYFRVSGDATWAVTETLRTTGRALLFTSLVLSAGFFLYMFSSMGNLKDFGFLTGFCIVTAFLADVLLAPALMVLARGRSPQAGAQTLAEEEALSLRAG